MSTTIYAEDLGPGDTIKLTDEMWQNLVTMTSHRPQTAKIVTVFGAPNWIYFYLDFGEAALILEYDQPVQIVTERLAP